MAYLVALLAPLVAFLVGQRWASSAKKTVALACVSAVCMYAITVGTAFGLSALYAHEADMFDTNKDGVISLNEQSKEQSEATERLVNDAGRNMTVFLAVPWSVGASGLFFLLVAVTKAVSRRHTGPKSGVGV